MKIDYHLTGNDRKKLVQDISEITGQTARYLYMPSCAYSIGDFYTVTREGDLGSATMRMKRKFSTFWKSWTAEATADRVLNPKISSRFICRLLHSVTEH